MQAQYLIAVLCGLTLGACAKQDSASVANTPAAPTPAASANTAAAAPAALNAGKVMQVAQAGPYTYAEVETADGQKVWIAGGHLEAKEGERIQWGKAEEMRNFSARSLGRTFDRILFVNVWGPEGGAAVGVAPHGNAATPPHPPMGTAPAGVGAMPGAMPAAAPAATAANSGEVKSVASAAGYTYVEVAREGGSVWVAGPETTVKVGDKVSWDGGMVMKDFNAKSLNRVFDSIVFAGALNVQH